MDKLLEPRRSHLININTVFHSERSQNTCQIPEMLQLYRIKTKEDIRESPPQFKNFEELAEAVPIERRSVAN